jgi:hypothetical protein
MGYTHWLMGIRIPYARKHVGKAFLYSMQRICQESVGTIPYLGWPRKLGYAKAFMTMITSGSMTKEFPT